MSNIDDFLLTLQVVKRNGKKVDFNGEKIAIAIKKGFDSVVIEDEEGEVTNKYTAKILK